MIPRIHLVLVALIYLASVAASIAVYPYLPDPAPIHWNVANEVDGWGPRWVAAFLMPMILLPLLALLVVIPRIGPQRESMATYLDVYGRIMVSLMLAMAALHGIILAAAAGAKLGLGESLGVVIGALFMALGNFMGKIRRNFWLGIRTPWTLASDRVWERTHRLGGRLMFAIGLAVAACCLTLPPWACFIVLMSGVALLVAWCLIYSYVCYKRLGSPDDLQPA